MMMDTPITRAEHEEFRRAVDAKFEDCKRSLEAEQKRTNHRLNNLEETSKQIGSIALSVEKLALSIENMVGEQKEQREELEELKNRDGEMWRKVTGYVITVVLGIIVGFIFNQIGM
jgi:archaellum component FlaC